VYQWACVDAGYSYELLLQQKPTMVERTYISVHPFQSAMKSLGKQINKTQLLKGQHTPNRGCDCHQGSHGPKLHTIQPLLRLSQLLCCVEQDLDDVHTLACTLVRCGLLCKTCKIDAVCTSSHTDIEDRTRNGADTGYQNQKLLYMWCIHRVVKPCFARCNQAHRTCKRVRELVETHGSGSLSPELSRPTS